MSFAKAFQDSCQLAEDVAGLAPYFATEPDQLFQIGKDVVCAVWNESVAEVAKAKADFVAFAARFQADLAAAQPKIAAISSDFDQLIQDLTP